MTAKHFLLPNAICAAMVAATCTQAQGLHPLVLHNPQSTTSRHTTPAQTTELKLIIPFAVPIGVPVAPLAPYFYSYRATQPRSLWSADPAEELRSNTNTQTDNALPTIPVPRAALIATHCTACHGGQSPKAGMSFDSIGNLSSDIRLKAIRAIVSGRMPLGEKLSTDEVRSLVNEFSDLNHGEAEAQR